METSKKAGREKKTIQGHQKKKKTAGQGSQKKNDRATGRATRKTIR